MLEIGACYQVRAVNLDTDKFGKHVLKEGWIHTWTFRGDFLEVPIIGQSHDDKDDQGEHYHIDTRFTAVDVFKSYMGLFFNSPASVPLICCSEPFYTYRPCIRTHLAMVGGITVDNTIRETVKKRKQLTTDQIKAAWSKCKKCPHHGYPLDEAECITTAEGFIVCPLHNLNVHKDTGMIREEYIDRNLWEIT